VSAPKKKKSVPKKTRSAGRPAGSDRNENIARIIDAAMKCFAEKGYAGTRFIDISEAVGFTRSAIYPYFPNKAELYHAVLQAIQQQHTAELQSVIHSDATFASRLEKILAIFVRDHETDYERSLFLAAVPIEMKRHPELADNSADNSAIPALITTFFQQAIADGDIADTFAPEDLLISFLGGVMGMSLLQTSMGTGDVRQASAATVAMLKGKFLRKG